MKAANAAANFKKLAKKGGKEKQGKQQSAGQDEAGMASAKVKKEEKKKDKEKRKAKKTRGTSLAGESSHQSSEENLALSGGPSKVDVEVNATTGPGPKEKDKTKKEVKKQKFVKSKGCEEAVEKAVNDFWESAWHICADRFFVTSAPVTVSLELRNTWLRIVEAEWQDPDMREHVTNRPNRIFFKDEPPLPLAFDTWSRGAMELLPTYRRESVMDPFLRDLDYFKVEESPKEEQDDQDDATSGRRESSGEQEQTAPLSEVNKSDSPAQASSPEQGKVSTVTALAGSIFQPKTSSQAYDHWDFELDKKVASTENPMKLLMEQQEHDDLGESFLSASEINKDSSSSPTQEGSVSISIVDHKSESEEATETGTTSDKTVNTILAGRAFSDESRSEVETSHSGRVKFSPSQCGGRAGSGTGIFRLPNETTSEALLKMQTRNGSDKRIVGPNAISTIDVTQERHSQEKTSVAAGERKSSLLFSDEEDGIEPLFEQKTVKVDTEDRTMGRLHEFKAKVRSSIGIMAEFNFDHLTSEKEKLYLKRKMANLQNRYKRQTMKFLANKATVQNNNLPQSPTDGPCFSSCSDSKASFEAAPEPPKPKPVKSAASVPVLNKPKATIPNVRPVMPINRQTDPSKDFQKKGMKMTKRPSLLKVPPNIENLHPRGPCNRDPDQRENRGVVPKRSSDTCLYAQTIRRRVEERKEEDECFPKNDFELQQGCPEGRGGGEIGDLL